MNFWQFSHFFIYWSSYIHSDLMECQLIRNWLKMKMMSPYKLLWNCCRNQFITFWYIFNVSCKSKYRYFVALLIIFDNHPIAIWNLHIGPLSIWCWGIWSLQFFKPVFLWLPISLFYTTPQILVKHRLYTFDAGLVQKKWCRPHFSCPWP